MRRVYAIQEGIPIETAREIVKFIKDQKLKKVQASIQGDQVRISSPSKDELQDAIRVLREKDFGDRSAFRQLSLGLDLLSSNAFGPRALM